MKSICDLIRYTVIKSYYICNDIMLVAIESNLIYI
jgi:hypothetical protein